MADAPHHTPLQVLAMIAAVAVALVAGVMIIRVGREHGYSPSAGSATVQQPPAPGVRARLIAGEIEMVRDWPALDIAIEAGESIDEALPAGPFDAECTITFMPGNNRRTHIGAMLQNGSLIIMRDGEVLLSDYAGAVAKLTLTPLPIWLPRRHEVVVYQFRNDGSRPVQLRAMWRAEGADAARPLQ